MLKFGLFNIQKILKIGNKGQQYLVNQLSVKTVAALLVLVMVFDGIMVPLQFGFLSSFEPQSAYAASSSWNFNGGANGSGDANIVNPSSTIKLKPNWWDANYTKRQKVTVNATDAVANGYSAKANVDLESLRSAGKVNNDLSDFRIVAKDRTTGTSTELDRDIVRGEGLSLNGGNDYVSVPNLSIAPTNTTLEMWVNPSSTINDTRIIDNIDGVKSPSPSFGLRFNNNKIEIWGTAWKILSSTNISPNVWTHLAIVFSGTSPNFNATLYKNGTPELTVSDNYIFYSLGIGSKLFYSGGTAGLNFDGQIDEVRISNSVRYSSNFTSQHTPFVSDANTVGLWHLDGDANDSSGNSNNGTLVGSPYYTEGKVVSSGNNAEVWFKTQSAINASSTSEASGNHSYYLYYGNTSATNPPENKDNVYELHDDFNDASFDGIKWGTFGTGYGSISENGGELTISNTTGASSERIGINSNYQMPIARIIETRTKQIVGRHATVIGFMSAPYSPYPHGDSTTDGVSIYSRADAATANASASNGTNSNTYVPTTQDYRNYQTMKMERVSSSTVNIYRNNVLQGNFTDSSAIPAQDLPVVFSADGWSPTTTVVIDWVKVRKYVSSEPTTSFASEESAGTAYATPGVWTSNVIAPTGHYDWGNLTIGKTTPGASTLTVDVLRSSDSTVLATDVASGTDLSAVVSNSEKSIKLRANLSGGVDTPTLSALSLDYSTDAIIPTDPSNLQITSVGSNSVDLSWTASSDSGGSGLAGYKIERAPDSADSPGTFAQVGTSATSSYTDATASGSTKYWYRVRAYDNASNNSGYTGLDGYSYKKNITFDTTAQGANVSTNQTNFPVAVHINSSSWPASSERTNFFDATNVGGKRVRFYDSDESTVLDYEVEYYNAPSQEAIYWVRVPQVDGNSSTDNIIVAYGNDPFGVDQDNGTGVWDSNFVGVWHMNQDPSRAAPQIQDSTSNNRDGTTFGSMQSSDLVSGNIGRAINFDGTNDYITASIGTLNAPYTVETWGYFDNLDQPNGDYDYFMMLSNTANTAASSISREKGDSGANSNKFYNWDGGAQRFGPALNGQTWLNTVLQGTTSSPYFNLYLNSVSQSLDASTAQGDSNGTLVIGRYNPGNSHYLDGKISEIRISNISRSADWIKLSYFSTKKTNFNGDNGEGASQFINFGSEVSTFASTLTLADTPTSPSAIAASASQMDVSWASGGNQNHYHVKSSSDNYTTPIYDSTSTSTLETGLNADSQYTYRIYGVNTDNVESSSYASASKYSLANVPAAPTVSNATSSSLDVVINENSNPTNTTYAIYNNTAAQYVQADGTLGASAVHKTYSAWGGASGITNTGLASNTSYTYKVEAKNGDNILTSFSSNSTPLSTLAGTPAAPTIGTATALSSTSIKYNFTDNADNEDGFKVHDESHNVVGTVTSANQTSITETGLSPNTQYSRHIHAYNGAGDSSASSSVSKYTLAASPSIGASNNTSTWYNSSDISFSSQNPFGSNGVAYYRYTFNKNASYIVSNTDSLWNSGTLPGITSSSGIYYLNIKSYNGDNEATSQVTYGPFHFDLEKPKVSITSHSSGDYVKGKITLEAQVSDNVGIADVGFYDNSLSNKIGSSTTTVFDTTKVSEGPRTIYAKTSDYAGNTVAHVIILNVDNTKPKPRSQKPGKKKGSAKAGTLKVKKGSSIKLYYRVDDRSSETTTKIYIYKRYKRKSFKARLRRSHYIRNRRARLRRAYHKIKRSKNRRLKRRARSFARQIRSYNRQLGRYNPYYIKTIKTYKKKVSTNKKIYYRYRATRKGVYRIAITAYDEANNRSAKPMVRWVNVK